MLYVRTLVVTFQIKNRWKAILPGWKTDMTKMKDETEFPKEFNDYIAFLEKELATPISIVSVGPDRQQTIERKR